MNIEVNMSEDKSQKVIGKQIKISRKNPDNVRPIAVNDLLITHSRDEFFLTFSMIEFPPILEEKDFENLQEVEAIAMVKIVVTPEFADALSQTLSKNLDSFKLEAQKNDKSK